MPSLRGVALLLVAAGIAAAGAWSYATHWHPATARFPLQGIDLGERPPAAIEWNVLRARGADFAYLVATSGADRRDPGFEAHWAALPEAGLRRGAIHLYSLCQPAEPQANAFNAFVPRTGDALPVAVDLSYRADCIARPDRARLVADVRRFAAMVETHTGHPIVLRLSADLDDDYRLSEAVDRPVWAIRNFLEPRYPARLWRLWRASDLRRIEGIDRPVNWDVVAP